MGFDLYRDNPSLEGEEPVNDYYRFSIWGFPPVRFLAEANGWIPMGTTVITNEGNEFECGYDTNDGQIVCAEDAKNWANALELAIDTIPEEPIHEEMRRIDTQDFKQERKDIWSGCPTACANYFAGDRQYILDFIEYLRRGAFKIW